MNQMLHTILFLFVSTIVADDELHKKPQHIKNVLRGGASRSKEASVLTLIENGEENAVEVDSWYTTCSAFSYGSCVGDIEYITLGFIPTQQDCYEVCEQLGSGCCQYTEETFGGTCYHGPTASLDQGQGYCENWPCTSWASMCSPCGDFSQAESATVCSGGCGGDYCPSPNSQHRCSGTCGDHTWKGGGFNTRQQCRQWCAQQGAGCCESRANGACSWKSSTTIEESAAYTDSKAVICNLSNTRRWRIRPRTLPHPPIPKWRRRMTP